MKFKKIIANALCTVLILSNMAVVSANNTIINESPLNDVGTEVYDVDSDSDTEWITDESNVTQIEVSYNQSSNYSVTIPKTITLDSDKQAAYSIKVTGDIATNQHVYVAPVDGILETDNTDFYMKDITSGNKKPDVKASVKQNKVYWNSEEAASGYEETGNSVSAPDLTAGTELLRLKLNYRRRKPMSIIM